MNSSRDPDLLIKAFLEDGINELPDRSFDVVRASIERTRQRVVFGPWREEVMRRYATYGIAAAAVVLIAAFGIRLLPSLGGPAAPGATSSPLPFPAPSASPTLMAQATPAPTPQAPPTTGGVVTPLTERYTSTMNGIAVSYPGGWTPRAASEPWDGSWLNQESAGADVILERDTDSAFIALASQPLDGSTSEQWLEDFVALGSTENCTAPRRQVVGGAEAMITECDDGPHLVLFNNERAFVVWIYGISDPAFEEDVLATVQLNPTGAPPLTQQYRSETNGVTVSHPAGWTVQPATEVWDGNWLTQESSGADVITERESDSSFIAVAAQPLGGVAGDQWIDDFIALGSSENCSATRPHRIAGVDGVVTECEDGLHALVTSQDRGYVVWLYGIDDPVYFEQILATVQLESPAGQ